jgi:hypothetical protein
MQRLPSAADHPMPGPGPSAGPPSGPGGKILAITPLPRSAGPDATEALEWRAVQPTFRPTGTRGGEAQPYDGVRRGVVHLRAIDIPAGPWHARSAGRCASGRDLRYVMPEPDVPPVPAHVPGQPVRVLSSTRPAPVPPRRARPPGSAPTAKEWSDDIRA